MRMSDSKGTDVRLSPFHVYQRKLWPRLSIETKFWRWQIRQSYPFRKEQPINVLELRALLNYLRFRRKKQHKLCTRILIILDSQVAVSVASKGRSSSLQLNAVLQRIAALCLACRFQIVYAWCRSALNPADAPSRRPWVSRS